MYCLIGKSDNRNMFICIKITLVSVSLMLLALALRCFEELVSFPQAQGHIAGAITYYGIYQLLRINIFAAREMHFGCARYI